MPTPNESGPARSAVPPRGIASGDGELAGGTGDRRGDAAPRKRRRRRRGGERLVEEPLGWGRDGLVVMAQSVPRYCFRRAGALPPFRVMWK